MAILETSCQTSSPIPWDGCSFAEYCVCMHNTTACSVRLYIVYFILHAAMNFHSDNSCETQKTGAFQTRQSVRQTFELIW